MFPWTCDHTLSTPSDPREASLEPSLSSWDSDIFPDECLKYHTVSDLVLTIDLSVDIHHNSDNT